MFVISIVSPKGCNEQLIIKQLVELTSFDLVCDEDVFKKVEQLFGVKEKKLQKSLFETSNFGVFDKLKHKKNLCYFKIALAQSILDFNKIYFGVGTYFIPTNLQNLLRLAFGADLSFRIGTYAKNARISLHQAESIVKKYDKQLMQFTRYHLNKKPFSPDFFDANIDVSKYKVEEVAKRIFELMQSKITEPLAEGQKKINDLIIACKVQLYFLLMGEDVETAFSNGKLTVFLKKLKIRMENYANKIKESVPNLPEIKEVEVIPGKSIEIPSTMSVKLEQPRLVMLVDDEIEFVDTLSERLANREFRTSVAYSGEEAIENITKEVPDVIILDLKMPGIDGIEVLRRVKKEHPETEVIILTGHGSEKEKQIAYELGAFGYLEKPVDIDVLSETIRKAYEKIHRMKNLNEGEKP
ncbi:response regulator [Bacteroidetes/Chlorobi group bacterium Naka2016]|jgi:CheY-like chemotaxis protein|nr:MAG: response regulator [Bacteroidetes/Chlorobi group bacterium Naka2016]